MPKKTTLRGQFLRTVLLMLACSLLVGLAVIVAVMIAFVEKVPDGEQFLMDSVSFLFGKEVLGPNGMIHVVVLAAIALCLLVVLVCVLLASRYTSRVAAALREFRRAAEDGIPLKGYMHWSVMDNFEWAFGYNKRFGLIYVDYQTQERTIKDSGYWYKEVIESNGESL